MSGGQRGAPFRRQEAWHAGIVVLGAAAIGAVAAFASQHMVLGQRLAAPTVAHAVSGVVAEHSAGLSPLGPFFKPRRYLTATVTVEAGPARWVTPRRNLGLRLQAPGERRTNGPFVVDEAAFSEALDRIALQASQQSHPGVFDLDTPQVHRPRPGLEIDRNPARARLQAALLRGNRVVKLPTRRRGVASPEGPYVPKDLSVATLLASYQTEYERYHDHRNRAHNVRTAARRLHGMIVPPGGVLSFNDRVGARSPRNGFRTAPVIYRGELASDFGGGVCQAASTLHAAAFFAGLERVQVRPHSRPAGYVPMGLDATVVWPHQDLRLRNPYPFPLLVRSVARDGAHRVEIYGSRALRDITWERTFVSTRSYTTRRVPKPGLSSGTVEKAQRGIRGHTLELRRTIREGGQERTETDRIVYPPTDEILRVGSSQANP